MWKKILMGATLALFIAIVLSEDASTERSKPKRYRIIKMYGRRLKPLTTSTTTPAPASFGPPIKIRANKNETSSEESLPRDMLHSQSHRQNPGNIVNIGEMDLQNFDVGKLLAAAGHNSNGDPNAPTIVRFSAPSSDAHLDPAYLTKLIREQLGSDAQFQILPPSSLDQAKPTASSVQGYTPSSSNHQQQQLRGGFKQVFPFSKPSSSPEVLVQSRPIPTGTYSSQYVKSHYDGSNSKEQQGVGLQNQPTSTVFPHKLQYKKPLVQQTVVTQPPNSNSYSPLPNLAPTKNWPLFPRNPTPSTNYYEVSRPTSAPPHKYTPSSAPPIPYHPVSPSPGSFYKAVPSSPETAPEQQRSFGYSTLSQAMTPPDLQPAILGQYGQGLEEDFENNGHSGTGSKYSTKFVRGFVDDDTYVQSTSGQQQTKHNGKPQLDVYSEPQKQWKTIGHTPHSHSHNNSPKAPSQSFTLPISPQSFTLPIPPQSYQHAPTKSHGIQSTDFHYHSPTKSQSQNYESYAPLNSRVNQDDRGQGIEDYVKNFGSEYGPPSAQTLIQKPSYSSAHIEQPHGQPSQNSQPSITKTIYVNLPPESPTTTTPKPYHHLVLPQKHYKIVFIKAPTAPPPEEPEIQLTPSPEMKTIIYVLHKKPEPAKKIVVTVPPPTKPPAPEVFFVQYKGEGKDKKEQGWDNRNQGQGEGEIWDNKNTPEKSWANNNREQWNNDNNGDNREWGEEYSPSEIDTTNAWSPIYANNKSDDEEHEESYDDDGYRGEGAHYDMSSSSSTIHVNVKKSISDKN